MSKELIDIEELRQDTLNFNKGTYEGEGLIKKSLERFKAGRSVLIDKNNNIITSMMIDANLNVDVNELGDDIANALAKQLTTVVTTSVGIVIEDARKEITIVFEHNGKEVHRTTRTVTNSNEGAALARKICAEVERDLHISDVTYSFVG